MGLDTSHNCWHGAYSAFTRWRHKLAEVAGYQFEKCSPPHDYMTQVAIDWAALEAAHPNIYAGEWSVMPDDALLLLLCHSDCDGEIKPEHAGPLADRLETLLPLLDGDGGGHIGLYREKTQQFITGLRDAAANGEAVDFH